MELGKKTLVMGILNITPDSFSDGGKFFSIEEAVKQAEKLVADGADIIDIGAESTRPNAEPITAEVEISRLEKIIPVVKKFSVPISIDTYKPSVAEFALKCGANIINDVHGVSAEMLDLAKKYSAPVIATCDFGGGEIISTVKNFFRQIQKKTVGVEVIFDFGIGFGKTQEENLILLKNLAEFKNFPTLLGVSRKSVIGYATGFEVDNRDEPTGAICVLAIKAGVDILRVHNVKMISKMCKMADCLIR